MLDGKQIARRDVRSNFEILESRTIGKTLSNRISCDENLPLEGQETGPKLKFALLICEQCLLISLVIGLALFGTLVDIILFSIV